MKLLRMLWQDVKKNTIAYVVILLFLSFPPLLWFLSSSSTDSIIKKLLILFAHNKKKWTIICDSLKNIDQHIQLSNGKGLWVIHSYGTQYKDYSYDTEQGDERLIALRKYMDYLYSEPTDGFSYIMNYNEEGFIMFHTTTLDIYHNEISIIYSKVSTDSIKKVFSECDFCDSLNQPTNIGKWLYKLEDNWYIYSP